MEHYCYSRFTAKRQITREVSIGSVGVGGDQPIRIQSMTTTPTQDVQATVKQVLQLAEAGCDIVRITAPNPSAAKALGAIHKQVREAKVDTPLVADIHFLPSAAMEAVEHVEKVRVNPGNYADKKRFKVKEYSDNEYEAELQRLYESFSPLVIRAKELGRALRIGTNHGSLSDRIMNRYGDSPLGMVESALEFIRIAESHGFQDIVLSMKASNPKVMIAAYRLAVAKMRSEDMSYPLHLGVTEAGDGEDARVKSAIGIGSLLYDGLGDTIRVSLTEDPVHEVPVARALAEKATKLWELPPKPADYDDTLDPYTYTRRLTYELNLGSSCQIGTSQAPSVITPIHFPLTEAKVIADAIHGAQDGLREARIESLLFKLDDVNELDHLPSLATQLPEDIHFIVLELSDDISLDALASVSWPSSLGIILCHSFDNTNWEDIPLWANYCQENSLHLAISLCSACDKSLGSLLQSIESSRILFTLDKPFSQAHPVGSYRELAHHLKQHNIHAPIWIRATDAHSLQAENYFSSHLLEASMLAGSLFCDGIGDTLSIESETDPQRSTALAYNVLQGSRMRITRTEYVACPSCGRTLFDLQTTTQRIREKTDHLVGVTIAVMGCIVNGPGEMADADFGYVGGTPGKINLYVGKECVKVNIPEDEAVDRLIDLIREHNKWQEPALTA